MKAALALLSNEKIQRFVRQVATQIHQEHDFPLFSSLLPAHVSLKLGFEYENLARLERFCEDLADEVRPVRVTFDRFYLWERDPEYGVLGLNVVETEVLRGLHNRINRDLGQAVRDPSAPFDGADFHFHMTIEMARDRESMRALRTTWHKLPSREVNLGFIAAELALFTNRSEDMDSINAFKLQRAFPLRGGRR